MLVALLWCVDLICTCFNSLHDEVEMGYFVARYVMCLLIFVLGLQAPGLMSMRDFLDSDTARLHDMVCYKFHVILPCASHHLQINAN